jgi:NADP-dependent 3-hydroxy acid dehydrogenase YdfG
LGSALAIKYAKAGWRVFASARNTAKLEETKSTGIESIQLDVLSQDSILKAVASIKDLTGGSLDTLVLNAGGTYTMPLMDTDIATMRSMYELNVFSNVSLVQAFVPLLLKSTHEPMVVCHTSAASVIVAPMQGVYDSSKAAMGMIAQTLYLELLPFNISVVEIKSGAVKSHFYDNKNVARLPPNSIYDIAREEIEKSPIMSGNQDGQSVGDRHQWADQVLKGLLKRNPPRLIWAGHMAWLVPYLTTWFPASFMDGMMKKASGVDVLERKIREKGVPPNLSK